MTDVQELTGKCLCGAITFTVASPSGRIGACHCKMCRTWSGGLVFAIEDARDLVISGEENLGVFKSSDWGERCFCKTCGTNLFWRSEQFNHTAVMAGSIEQEDRLTFASEIYVDRSPGYFAFANETNKMTEAEFLAQFAPPSDS